MEEPNTSLWNSVIKGHANLGLSEEALSVFRRMRMKGIPCDGFTFPLLNKLLFLECDASFCEMIHGLGFRMGFESDVYFCNTVMDSYLRSDCFENACKVFDEIPKRDLVSWTSLISGYVHRGKSSEAFILFDKMRRELNPNEVTMIVLLQACRDVVAGRQLHGFVIKSGSLIDRKLSNSILKMYVDFRSTFDSEIAFNEAVIRDSSSWNTMISLYSSNGMAEKMMECFRRSKFSSTEPPNAETLTLLVSGLAENRYSSRGTELHCLAIKCGALDDILVTVLLEFYSKSSDLQATTRLFEEVTSKSRGVWNAYISGWLVNGFPSEAIELFRRMLSTGLHPGVENLQNVIVSCSDLTTLRLGKASHGYYIRNFVSKSDEEEQATTRSLETCFLNMYIRCGDIASARRCFDGMPAKDLVAYSSMIDGCGTHGFGSESLRLVDRMRSEGMEPNSVTFLSLLSGCSHSGLLREGCQLFDAMKNECPVEPELDHYTCIVDLLARNGKTREALSIIIRFLDSPDSKIWGALAAAAALYDDRKIASFAAGKVEETGDADYGILVSNLQAKFGRWDEVIQVRNGLKRGNDYEGVFGWSCLEIGGSFVSFVSGDGRRNNASQSHCGIDYEVYRSLESLMRNL